MTQNLRCLSTSPSLPPPSFLSYTQCLYSHYWPSRIRIIISPQNFKRTCRQFSRALERLKKQRMSNRSLLACNFQNTYNIWVIPTPSWYLHSGYCAQTWKNGGCVTVCWMDLTITIASFIISTILRLDTMVYPMQLLVHIIFYRIPYWIGITIDI